MRSYLSDGREHYEKLLARPHDHVAPRIVATARLGAGRLAWCQDADLAAIEHLLIARRLYEEIGLAQGAGLACAMLGFAHRNLGNAAEARSFFERAHAIGEAEKSERILATASSGLGSLAGDHGDLATARTLKEQSLASVRALRDLWVIDLISWSLGKVCVALGDHEAAWTYLKESLLISRELGNKWSVSYALEAIGDISARAAKGEKAVRLYASAAALRAALGLTFSVSEKTAHEEGLNHVRSLVTPAVFEQEWAAGQALSLHDSINLAIDDETEDRRPRARPPRAG